MRKVSRVQSPLTCFRKASGILPLPDPRPGFAVLILKDIFRFSHTAFGFSFGFRCPCNSRNWTLPFFRVKPHRNDVLKYLLTFSFQFLTFSRFSFSIFTAFFNNSVELFLHVE